MKFSPGKVILKYFFYSNVFQLPLLQGVFIRQLLFLNVIPYLLAVKLRTVKLHIVNMYGLNGFSEIDANSALNSGQPAHAALHPR